MSKSLRMGLLSCATICFALSEYVAVEAGDKSDKKQFVEKKRGIDPDDPSVFWDTPFRLGTGKEVYNGWAYEKTGLWVALTTKLVLPNERADVIRRDKDNEVHLFIEKSFQNFFLLNERAWPVLTLRSKLGIAAKLEKGELLIGTFGERMYIEGNNSIRLVAIVPKELQLGYRQGLSGGSRGGTVRPAGLINPGPADPKPALTKTKDGRPEMWMPPTLEDGWHEIPVVPDKTRRAKK